MRLVLNLPLKDENRRFSQRNLVEMAADLHYVGDKSGTLPFQSVDSATVKRTRQADPADAVGRRQVSVTRSRPTRNRRKKRDTSPL